MSPEQLRQQVQTLRAMLRDTLRQFNPTMARMSDAQTDASVAQLEQMAKNTDLIRMATEGAELFATEHEVLSSGGEGYEQSQLGIQAE